MSQGKAHEPRVRAFALALMRRGYRGKKVKDFVKRLTGDEVHEVTLWQWKKREVDPTSAEAKEWDLRTGVLLENLKVFESIKSESTEKERRWGSLFANVLFTHPTLDIDVALAVTGLEYLVSITGDPSYFSLANRCTAEWEASNVLVGNVAAADKSLAPTLACLYALEVARGAQDFAAALPLLSQYRDVVKGVLSEYQQVDAISPPRLPKDKSKPKSQREINFYEAIITFRRCALGFRELSKLDLPREVKNEANALFQQTARFRERLLASFPKGKQAMNNGINGLKEEAKRERNNRSPVLQGLRPGRGAPASG